MHNAQIRLLESGADIPKVFGLVGNLGGALFARAYHLEYCVRLADNFVESTGPSAGNSSSASPSICSEPSSSGLRHNLVMGLWSGSEPGALRPPPNPASPRIDYTSPSLSIQRVLFRYKLEGAARDWQNAGTRRQAFYTEPRPGNYRFRVTASIEGGILNETGATLAFVVPPTRLETAWFKLFCLLAASTALALITIWRLSEMTRKLKSRLSERIARELHDTVLQGFPGLVLRFQTAARQIPEDEPARSMMETALYRADEILIEGRHRVLDLRAASSHLGDLSEASGVVGDELALTHPAAFVFTVKSLL